MKHLNVSLVFNDYRDLDDKQNWIKLMDYINAKNATIIVYMSHFFANDKDCKDELDNTYFAKLSDNFAKSEGQIASYWCHLTEKYVLKMTKFSNE